MNASTVLVTQDTWNGEANKAYLPKSATNRRIIVLSSTQSSPRLLLRHLRGVNSIESQRAELQHLQSSYPMDRSRKRLVYMRMMTAQVAKLSVRAVVTYWMVSWFGGLVKLGITPAGGNPAGPFKSV